MTIERESETFGALLRQFRRAAGLSQAELAERAGLSRRGVSDLERGARRVPHSATVRRLAATLSLAKDQRAALLASGRHVALVSSTRTVPRQGATTPVVLFPAERARGPRERRGSLRAPGRPKHNLPRELSSFVGREQARAEVLRLLGSTRLLTLVGAAGIGKTRLALRAAAEMLARPAREPGGALVHGAGAAPRPDGVWLVRLEALADPSLVPAAIASVLDVREQPGRPLLGTLIDAIGSRHLLLVLDNCEHLVNACAELAEALLQGCPRLRLLATSREPLQVAGEYAWRVPSLSLPEVHHATAADELRQSEAVRLFIDRASAARRGFALTDQNAPAVAEVCWRLDGLPLAIELAAARTTALSVEQLAQRLNDSFRLLTGGGRTALPRQQTLRAALDWSYHLLSEPEQALFRRLGTFVGGWTLEAAEVVCAGQGIASDEVLDRLCSLVDKSLVSAEERDDAERYRLLETLRQYALERLEASGEAEVIRRQHAEHFLALAEQAEPELRGAAQTRWVERLEAEHDNLRAALAWTLDQGEWPIAQRLGVALAWFWGLRGHAGEGRRWLERVLAADTGHTLVRGRVLDGAGYLACAQSAPERAMSLLHEALALQRELGDWPGMAFSLGCLGRVAQLQGDHRRARALLEQALALARDLGDMWTIAVMLHSLGLLAQQLGDHARAEGLYQEALALRRERGDTWGIAASLGELGGMAHNQGQTERAAVFLEEALALQREVGDKRGIASSLHKLGDLARHAGERERAAALLEEALALRRQTGQLNGVGHALRSLGHLAQQQGDTLRAAALLREALLLQKEIGDKVGVAGTLEALAGVVAAIGPRTRVARLLGASQALRGGLGAPLSPLERADYERQVRTARALLGEAAFASGWAEGQALPLEQVIAEALETTTGQDAQAAAVEPARAPDDRRGPLSEREWEVAERIARGYTNHAIAQDLVIAEGTAARHVANILNKLGLHSRAQVAVWAVGRGRSPVENSG